MNATERVALLDGLVLHDELRATVDAKTLEILDRRRRTAVIKGRGWLVRRMLLAADLAGLVVAMALAEWLVNWHNSIGVLGARAEVVAFIVSLPVWVVIAKLYGLYEHDEERTDHSTTDDFRSNLPRSWFLLAISLHSQLSASRSQLYPPSRLCP